VSLLRPFIVLALVAGLMAAKLSVADTGAWTQRLNVTARTIDHFEIGSEKTRFGPFEFVGGLELTNGNLNFGGLSAIRFLDSGTHFLGVEDIGFWYAGTILRDGEGRPTGVGDFRLAPMLDHKGDLLHEKWRSDAESLVVAGDRVAVGFEREHRIDSYRLDYRTLHMVPRRRLPLLIPLRELRRNRSLEALTVAPASSPLGASRVVVTERSLNKRGDIFAAVLEGPRKGIFFVHRSDGYDVSDADFLPNGDLLLLERQFSIVEGIRMRIRRIAAADIRPGATVDGPTLLEAGPRDQIDNMEGLDVWTDPSGKTRISLISDDNQSFFQRTVYLEFRLAQ
jgi:hypothetical protein